MEYRQLKLALFVVWIVLSGIILVSLVAPFLISSDSIIAIVPECDWKVKYDKECLLCGLTRSFVCISQGSFTKAQKLNKFSVYIFMFFLLNEVAVMSLLIRELKKSRHFIKMILLHFGKYK